MGLVFAIGGSVWAILVRGRYQITVRMSSGEVWRTETKDGAWAQQLAGAMSQAMVAAGR